MAIDRDCLSVGIVTFIDLLGFSDRISAMRTEQDLESVERDVQRVQQWFGHKPTDEIDQETARLKAKTVLAFSDSVVISVPSNSEMADLDGDFDPLLEEVHSLAIAQGQCVINNIFLRGATDYGLWYQKGDTLISPAMVVAYHLERDACVPMIAFSDDFLEHFRKHPHREFYSSDIEPVANLFRKYDSLPNGKSHWLLDYLPLCIAERDGNILASDRAEYDEASTERRNQMRSAAFERDCRAYAGWHREAIVTALKAATIPNVKAKYEWLANYHNEVIHRVFVSPDSSLLIEV